MSEQRYTKFFDSYRDHGFKDSDSVNALLERTMKVEGTSYGEKGTGIPSSPTGWDLPFGFERHLSENTKGVLERHGGMSNLSIGQAMDVGREVKASHRKELEAAGEDPDLNSSAVGGVQITGQNMAYIEDQWHWAFPETQEAFYDMDFSPEVQSKLFHILLYKQGMTAFLNSDNTKSDRKLIVTAIKGEWQGIQKEIDGDPLKFSEYENLLDAIWNDVNDSYQERQNAKGKR